MNTTNSTIENSIAEQDRLKSIAIWLKNHRPRSRLLGLASYIAVITTLLTLGTQGGCGANNSAPKDAGSGIVDGAPRDGGTHITATLIAGNFIGPESAQWDPLKQLWYVSNFGQNIDLTGGTADQPGYISKIAADGTVLDERFVEMPGDFVGMAVAGDTLYVSHVTELLAVNTSTAAVTTIPVANASFLNDVTESNGTVYISDSVTNVIYRYQAGMAKADIFSRDPALVAPNGLQTTDNGQLIAATIGAFPPNPATPGALFKLDSQGVATRLGQLSGIFDGVETLDGDLIVSDFGGKIYRVDSTGTETLVVNLSVAPNSLMSAADIGINPDNRSMLIPDLAGNRAYFVTLPAK